MKSQYVGVLVPDIMNFGGHNVPEEISEALDRLGYVSRYTLLNAAFYGVPQLRERLFLIALDASLGLNPSFPKPSHTLKLPTGYEGARSFALKHVKLEESHFSSIPDADQDLSASTTIAEALSDLPFISEHLHAPAITRKRRVSDKLPYRADAVISSYARMMREWPGFESDEEVDGNVVRLTQRDFPIFGRMPRGSYYPIALNIARQLL